MRSCELFLHVCRRLNPRGITESDVHGVADALVADGERPTVERIRAYLGTGSPNTVVRWLETWWQGLGARVATDR
ncbi:DNA-binding protein [Xanthomonas dyei]|uniref:DNA-binding protein n=1 Tax=Xanthomonas dyei TaxID=743699 RepID=UPI001E45691D|nr:DNA-binding protein [Xanthomonas dyei]MCC4634776.1 DNA-binding protein [Xanthomonas dyei pv. eucalypti]